jgi:ribosomal protein S18 acetylase RimI-like enzyme
MLLMQQRIVCSLREGAMLSLEPAQNEQQFEELLQIIYNQQTAYLNPVLDLIELTWEQFGAYFRATGTAYRIWRAGNLLGLCWVAEHLNTLDLLGLIVKTEYQGQGIGTQALTWLEEHRPDSIRAIELQVHASNPRARSLYERLGYQVITYSESSCFYTMRKELQQP